MTRWPSRATFLAAGLALAAAPAFAQGTRAPTFSRNILPIFERSCQRCHRGDDAKAGLKLDSHANVLTGSARGAIIVPGSPDNSKLIQLVESRDPTKRMPPAGNRALTVQERFILRGWITAGAKNDVELTAPTPAAAAQPLTLVSPKDGANVREQVKISVARSSIPPEGFIAVYIDNKFKVALAPPSEEELDEKKLKHDTPVSYTWDTRAPFTDDATQSKEEAYAGDGPHVIEIKSYNSEGALVETAAAQVNLRNQVEYTSNQPVKLWYNNPRVKQYVLQHVVDLEANAPSVGTSRRGQAAAVLGGPDRFTHKETTHYLVSMEDLMPASVTGFWRERRESPIIIVVNNLKNVVRVESSSRYYPMERTGMVRKSKVMERESREPILNPINLPGRSHRMDQPFDTSLRINLGAYIPGALTVDRLTATLDGIEWRQGERCVRIVLNYNAGKGKVNIHSLNIYQADFDITQGNSTIWFSEETNRVIDAKHNITGTIAVDVSQLGGAGGAGSMGGPGGEYAPGGDSGAMPGGMYGMPGGGMGAGAFGAPYGGGGGNGPGRAGAFGSPYGGGGGNGPGGAMPGGYGGGMPAGMPGGMPGAYGAPGGMYGGAGDMGGGGGTGITQVGPQIKRYHVNLKVNTNVEVDPAPARK